VTSSIEAVLFDFGGVFTGSPFQAIDKYAAAQGVEPEDLMDLVFGSYHADTDHPWHQCERGELGLGEAFTQITANATEAGIRFDDPAVGISWPLPIDELLYSERDATAPTLAEVAESLPFAI